MKVTALIVLCLIVWRSMEQNIDDQQQQQLAKDAAQYVKQKYGEDEGGLVKSEEIELERYGSQVVYNARLVYKNGHEYIVSIQRPISNNKQKQTQFFVTAKQHYTLQPIKIQDYRPRSQQQVRPMTRIMSKSQKQSANDRVVYDGMVGRKMKEYRGIRDSMESRNRITDDRMDRNRKQIVNDVYEEQDTDQEQFGDRMDWTADSYKLKPRQQPPNYQNQSEVDQIVEQLRNMPQLVNELEVEQLKDDMLDVNDGNSMMMVLGDCAENFDECSQHNIARKYYFYELMARNLEQKMKKKIIKLGRIGGQYCKPRSSPYEVIDGKEVYSYKGDIINRFDVDNRTPDPKLLLTGYEKSAQTLNFLSQMKDSSLDQFQLQYSNEIQYDEEYVNKLINDIKSRTYEHHPNHPLYTAHEALSLEYESGLVRTKHNKVYDLSAHFLWIGERTRRLDYAHIEFLRGIENPIGVKVSSKFEDQEFIDLVQKLNPNNLENRLVIIIRMGDDIERLRDLVRIKKENGLNLIWMSDPVHGNTVSEKNVKTRYMDTISNEIEQVQKILKEEGEVLGGIHLEATPEVVNECVGIDTDLDNLAEVYTSKCDPRLNIAQTYSILSKMGQQTQ